LIQRRCRLLQARLRNAASCSADCAAMMFRSCPLLDVVAGVHLAVKDRRRVRDDVVDLRQVVRETLRDVRRRIDKPLQRRANPPTAAEVSVSSESILLLGSTARPRVRVVQRRATSLGTAPICVMV